MSLSATEIAELVDEIAPLLTDGWIQKISQPLPRVVVLEIRAPGKTHRLLVSASPGTARLHLLSYPLRNPQTPPIFCQFLRAHIQGARIQSLAQVGNDRIVKLALQRSDGACALIVELTGKKADVLLVDREGKVMAALSGDKERIGRPYHPPPNGRMSIPGSDMFLSAWPSGGMSANIETRYRLLDEEIAREHARRSRLTSLKKAIKRETRRIDAWQQDLAKATKYRGYNRYGELLKANLGSIKKGMDRVTLVDYFDVTLPKVTIPLDASKSAQGNMDDYFRKHRKYLTAERGLKPRMEQAERDVEKLRQEFHAIEEGTWTAPDSPPAAPRSAIRTSMRTRIGSEEKRRGPFRRFTSTDGHPIFVGRNARENDELTFGLAKSEDLWLHARGTPGSHVVVRLERGADPPPETLRDAATLALLYSNFKKSGKGDVIYTKKKWVKKAKGQAPGAVLVTQERSIYVTLDKTRLDALKQRTG